MGLYYMDSEEEARHFGGHMLTTKGTKGTKKAKGTATV